jgi:hypothetical protein
MVAVSLRSVRFRETIMNRLLITFAMLPAAAMALPQAASARDVMRAATSPSHGHVSQGAFGQIAGPGFPVNGPSGIAGPGFPGQDGHHHRRGHEWGAQGGYWPVYGYGGVYEDPEKLRQAGYFSGPAGSWVEDGQVHHDYDRGYPYDWYRERNRAEAPRMSGAPREARVSCAVETAGVRVCRGGR